jgi:hypothetical protein
VHQPRDEPLQQLPLAEHDLGLRAHAPRHVVVPRDRFRAPHQPDEGRRPPREQAAADGDERGQRDRAYPRTFRSSALIAGTIWCRSPMTA